MIYAMTMATESYMPSALFQLETARKKGKVDRTICFNIDRDIDDRFKKENYQLLTSGSGRRRGYYCWKAYFANKALDFINYGDYLIYMDAAGFYYKKSVDEIVRYMKSNDIEMIISRRFKYLEKHWTKRDAFVYMGCDEEKYWNQYQCMSGFYVIKKTKKVEQIFGEWLYYSQDARIINDDPNTCGMDNYEGFVENRHDQSIFSLLMTKYGIKSIEQTEIPDFHKYHHTMETSVSRVNKVLQKQRIEKIKEFIGTKEWKGIYYLERERFENISFIQRWQRKRSKNL